MNWVEDDIRVTLGQSEYIDTAIVPVGRISWGTQTIEHSNSLEYLKKICLVLEQQFRGRMILFPPILCCGSISDSTEPLYDQLTKENIKYIFILTCESQVQFKDVIHIPYLPIQKMDYENQLIIINSQIDEIMKKISHYWK